MKKFLSFIVGFILALILFMPKENLIFKAQQLLSHYNIFINYNYLTSSLISLEIKNATIFYNQIETTKIENIDITPLLLFNKIDIKNAKITIGEYKITDLNIYNFLFIPTIYIKGKANFGDIQGEVSLLNREIKVYIKNPSYYIKSFLKKDKKGYFYYAKF